MKKLRAISLGQIESLGKFKDKCQGPMQEVVTQLSKEISVLELEVAGNYKIADLVVIEIRALFAKSLAKI